MGLRSYAEDAMHLYEELTKRVKEYIRILKLAKRPKREEFFKISKIAGAAMGLIGTIGFTIYLLMTVVPKGI